VSWPRSLLARNAALIVALVLVGQIITFASHLVLVQLPRASQLADLTSQYLAVLEQTLAAAPRAERERIAREFSNGILRIESDPPPDGPIANPLTRIFAERIQTLMPDRTIVFTPSPNQTIWMEARVDGERMWVVTPAKGIVADNVNTWLMVSLIGVGIGGLWTIWQRQRASSAPASKRRRCQRMVRPSWRRSPPPSIAWSGISTCWTGTVP
jgi:two-component system, OmpR family, osmolarity sensor histidine kinase EnvZ